MDTTNREFDKPAKIKDIRQLHRDGLLSDEEFLAASAILRPAFDWFSWARQMLLFFGSTLVLSGIVFFFAYNWATMGKFLKFGIIELGMIACIAFAHLRGLSQLSGKVFLLSSSVFVGVFLAVYGQVYQTVADAFSLFIGWALLIIGWVMISEFAALWFLWLVLLNIGTVLYWQQVGNPAHAIRSEFLCLAIGTLNGVALILREIGIRKGFLWLSGKWLRGILLAASLTVLSIPVLNLVMDIGSTEKIRIFSTLIWVATSAGGYACYRFVFRDMMPLALIVLNICIVLLALIGKVLFHRTINSDYGIFLLFSLVILLVVSSAAFWLRKTAIAMEIEKESAR